MPFRTKESGLGKLGLIIASAFIALGLVCSPVFSQVFISDVIDPELDLDTQLKAHYSEVSPLVELGPSIVAGEGADENNYTLVRCMSQYGVPYLQFLAYPYGIRGGVNVNTGELFSSEGLEIVTNAITSTATRKIRVFTNTGLLKSDITPPANIAAPFVVAVGNFIASSAGDEIAVSQRSPSGQEQIWFCDATGSQLTAPNAPISAPQASEIVELSTLHVSGEDLLLIGYRLAGAVYVMKASTGTWQSYNNSAIGAFTCLGESVYQNELYTTGLGYPDTSCTLKSMTGQSSVAKLTNVGEREKTFFVAPAADDTQWTDSEYVKNSLFRHLRTDLASPGLSDFEPDNNDYEHWAGGTYNNYIMSTQGDYLANVPSVWEPTFTYRHFPDLCQPWVNALDPATGYQRYTMLTRLNNEGQYYEGGGYFQELTYAAEPAIDHLYLWPLRAYLLELAEKFRGPQGDPEKLIALEPNHEFEIFLAQDYSIGDYNPQMIRGFLTHLLRLYNNLGVINTKFGTSFTEATFDAPRNSGRGSWDGYGTGNAYYNAWVEYNRKVVLTRLAQCDREALMAGFPPSAIKKHQIPANWALGTVIDNHRISPIDWALAASCGYGGTRYGVWYPNGDWLNDAYNSGFNMVNCGEYHPVTEDQNAANGQIDYMWNHGCNFIFSMTFDVNLNQIAQNAYLRAKDYGPRPGTAEGISEIRATSQPTSNGGVRNYNIVSMGKTGLLKSVKEDGTWEGTVYAEPFRQRTTVTALHENVSFTITTGDHTIGPVNGLKAGDQIDLSFTARSSSIDTKLTLLVLHNGVEMTNHRFHINVTSTAQNYRYTLRIQEPMETVTLLLNSGERDTPTGHNQTVEMTNFGAYVEKPAVARVEYGMSGSAAANTGGVTFDLLSTEHVPDNTLSSETWRSVWTAEPDPFCGSISVNAGATVVDSAGVSLALSATNATEIRLSNDGVVWSEWMPYATTKQWTLIRGIGTKTVYAQFKDASASVSSICSSEVEMIGADAALAFEFDTPWYTDGWQPTNSVSSLTVEDGCLLGTVSGVDPYMYVATSEIDATINKCLLIRMKIDSGSTAMWGWWSSGAFSSASFNVISDGQYHDYVVNLSSVAAWTGMVSMPRLDPADEATSGTFGVDFVRVMRKVSGTAWWEFTTAGCREGWYGGKGVSNLAVASSILAGDITESGAIVSGPRDPEVATTSRNLATIRMKTNSGTHATFGWFTSSGVYNSIEFPTVPDGAFHNYYVGLSGNAAWTGLIHGVRVNPADDASSGHFEIDYVRLTQDSGAPSSSISVNSGVTYTKSANVTLTISASDSVSTVAQMQFSNDNATWSNWEPYATTKAWTLSSGDGGKTVRARVKDVVGNTSSTAFDSITLDTTPPSAATPTDEGAYTINTTTTFAWVAATDATSGVPSYNCQVGTSPNAYDVFDGNTGISRTKSVTVSNGMHYYCRVQAIDRAGNVGAWSTSSDGITPVEITGIGIAAAKAYADNMSIGFSSMTISAVYGDSFYIEETGRMSGIKVISASGLPLNISIGKLVDIGAVIHTDSAGERWLDATVLVK